MDVLIEGIKVGISQMTWLEAIAVFFGLLSVWYARKENILVFPTGIVSVLIYVYICFGAKLYADMGINAYYFAMSLYGWYTWSFNSGEPALPISYNTPFETRMSTTILVISFTILWYALSNFTDSDVPVWDALTTSIFFVAMYLMARKKVENWIAWIVADFISIPLYFYKGLILTSFQFLVFLVLAIMGYITWKQQVDKARA
jgi:nicotinamide mononucleotide transporter